MIVIEQIKKRISDLPDTGEMLELREILEGIIGLVDALFHQEETCANCGDPIAENGNYCASCWTEENGAFGVGA